ncbi:MAG: pyridoxal-phosphate dependent enzyme [Chloroflexota bacterium]
MNKPLHIETPLLESRPLSEFVNGQVWLKMDALQPSGSFKLRGLGHACQQRVTDGAQRLMIASGGNAGIAVAYSGRKLGVPTVVIVPESVSPRAVEVLEQEQATVITEGASWQESHNHAMQIKQDQDGYLHPFDDPLVWAGHATMVDEVKQQGFMPDVVIASVGGGGLLCGVLEGLHRNDMASTPVIAVETEGAASLAKSVQAREPITLPAITSIATTLGAKRVAQNAFDWCQKHPVVNHVISDRQAVDACLHFARDHRVLVEPACGASLAPVYQSLDYLQDKERILVIVCGGSGVTMEQLQSWDASVV